jgi:hypothetical protein
MGTSRQPPWGCPRRRGKGSTTKRCHGFECGKSGRCAPARRSMTFNLMPLPSGSGLAAPHGWRPSQPCWPPGPRSAARRSWALKIAPLISNNPSGPCPASLALFETTQPSREGSAGIHGWAPNLGMTGLRDPNTLTPVIQRAGVWQGQAARSWSGSD